MRIIDFFIAALLLLSATAKASYHQPEFVRVKTFKNLKEFPFIQKAQVYKINEQAWGVEGSNLKFVGKKISNRNVILKKRRAI